MVRVGNTVLRHPRSHPSPLPMKPWPRVWVVRRVLNVSFSKQIGPLITFVFSCRVSALETGGPTYRSYKAYTCASVHRRARARACVRVCVRACMHACMRACVRACVRRSTELKRPTETPNPDQPCKQTSSQRKR